MVTLEQPAAAASGDISTIAGTGGVGEHGDGVPAVSATLDQPQGLTVDAHGNVADRGLQQQPCAGSAVSASNPGYSSRGCFDPCTWTVGDLYTIAGHGVGGYNGDGMPATHATLMFPAGVAVDAHGNPLIADSWQSAGAGGGGIDVESGLSVTQLDYR